MELSVLSSDWHQIRSAMNPTTDSHDSPSGEHVLRIDGLTKSFGHRTVVHDISFDVRHGETFGFLGPNGSGKTTTIRMALGILHPDSGAIRILGSPPGRVALREVGYLPEERGLPRSVRLLDAIRYLARLKGLSFTEAEERANALLERLNLYEHRHDKVEALSHGMTQLAQFVTAIVHDPELIILDEPFSGLDPLNVELMKEVLHEHQQAGATIMFSTHIMSDVEELCDRVALIAEGRLLLFGELDAIKHERGASAVQVRADRVPADLALDAGNRSNTGVVEYALANGRTPESVLRSYLDAGISIERFDLALPSLNEIFIEEVSRARAAS